MATIEPCQHCGQSQYQGRITHIHNPAHCTHCKQPCRPQCDLCHGYRQHVCFPCVELFDHTGKDTTHKPYISDLDQKFASDPEVRKRKSKRGRGSDKQPVMVLVEREGSARCFPIPNTTAATLKGEVAVNVAKEAVVMTDESRSYYNLREGGLHRTVEHTAKEYARRDPDGVIVHTNTAESFFALLKRGHYGVFHQMSKKHLHRYCTEFGFRWDHRKVSDGERMVAAIIGVDGKRLMYRAPTEKGLVG